MREPLRPGYNVADELERDKIVRRVRLGLRELQEFCNDVAHWNRLHPDQRFEYDPNGRCAAVCAKLGASLW